MRDAEVATASLIGHLFEPCPTSPEILCVWCGLAEIKHPADAAPDRNLAELLRDRS